MAIKYPQGDLPRSSEGALSSGASDLWDSPAGLILQGEFFGAGSADIRPTDAEWDWSEAVQPEFQVNGYQQTDLAEAPARQIDLDWNWDEWASDEWAVDQSVQPPVVAAGPTDLDWNWDEALQPEFVTLGYQNSDYVQPTPVYFDEWQWDDHADDEWHVEQTPQALVLNTERAIDTDWDWNEVVYPEVVSTGYQQADNAAAPSTSQPADLEWDFSADLAGEDGWTNHYTAYDPANPERAIDTDWDWNEFVTPEFIVLGYQQADNVVVADSSQQQQTDWDFSADLAGEDGWTNHYTAYDPANAERAIDTDWDWNEFVTPEFLVLGYQQVDNVVVADTSQQSQTDWNFDADFGGEDGWSNHTTAYDPATKTFDDAWNWDESYDDEWISDTVTPANNVVAVSPVQQMDAEWDWNEFVTPEFIVLGYQNADGTPPDPGGSGANDFVVLLRRRRR